MRQRDEQERLWTKPYITVIMTSLFSSFSFNMVSSLLTKYLISLGTSNTIAGIVVGLFSITALFARPIAGMSADRYNKKRLSVVTTLVLGLCMLGYTLTSNIGVILVVRIIHAIAFGMSGTSLASLVVDYIPENRMGEGIGYFGFGQILGTAVAPGIGIAISNRVGMTTAFYVSCLLGVAGAVFLALSKIKLVQHEKTEAQKKTGRLQFIAPEAISVTILGTIIAIMSGSVSSFLVVLGDSVGVGNVSIYFTISAFVMMAVRPFAGKIMDRKGMAVLMYPALLCGVVGMLILTRATALWLFMISAVFRSISQGVGFPALQAEAVRKTGKAKAGLANSTFMVGADLGNGIGPIIGGAIAESHGYPMIFLWVAALLLIGIAFFACVSRLEKRKLSRDKNML